MKILRAHLIEIVMAVLFILLGYFLYAGSTGLEEEPEGTPYNDGWVCTSGEGRAAYASLPNSIPLPKGADGIVLSKTLDSTILYHNTIGFYSSHQIISAYVDGQEIYRFQAPEGTVSKTPGSCWNFIQLQDSHAGKTLEIHIKNAYRSRTVRIPHFILGIKSEIRMGQIRQKLLPLAVSMVFLMLAGADADYQLVFHRQKNALFRRHPMDGAVLRPICHLVRPGIWDPRPYVRP